MTTHGVAPFPLYWPLQHPRTERRKESAFKVDFVTARTHLLSQLQLLGAKSVVLSTNIPIRRDGLPGVPDREPADPGVAVYFLRKDKPYVIACDQFRLIRWNLRAIGMTIEALRSIERNGTTSMLEQAFSGFAALPEKTPDRTWRDVLGFGPDERITAALARERYLSLCRTAHPDQGGTHHAMAELNGAWTSAMRELGGS